MKSSPLAEKMMIHDLSDSKIILDVYGFYLERFANKFSDKKFYFINEKKSGTYKNRIYLKGKFSKLYINFIEKIDLVYVEKIEKNYKEFINKIWEILKPGGKAYILFPLFGFENPVKFRIHPQDFTNEIIKYFAVRNVYFKRKNRTFYAIFYLEKI